MWKGRTYLMQLPRSKDPGKSYYAGRTGKPDREGFQETQQ